MCSLLKLLCRHSAHPAEPSALGSEMDVGTPRTPPRTTAGTSEMSDRMRRILRSREGAWVVGAGSQTLQIV